MGMNECHISDFSGGLLTTAVDKSVKNTLRIGRLKSTVTKSNGDKNHFVIEKGAQYSAQMKSNISVVHYLLGIDCACRK